MTHEDSPFRSPQTLDATEHSRFLTSLYVLLVIVAIVCHLVTYPTSMYASSLAKMLLVEAGPDQPDWLEPRFLALQKVLLVMVPVTFLLGAISVFLLWHQWDRHWYGAMLVAFLALIPWLAFVVFAYVLWRSSRELAVRHANQDAVSHPRISA